MVINHMLCLVNLLLWLISLLTCIQTKRKYGFFVNSYENHLLISKYDKLGGMASSFTFIELKAETFQHVCIFSKFYWVCFVHLLLQEFSGLCVLFM
jgi:hypothetical protein